VRNVKDPFTLYDELGGYFSFQSETLAYHVQNLECSEEMAFSNAASNRNQNIGSKNSGRFSSLEWNCYVLVSFLNRWIKRSVDITS